MTAQAELRSRCIDAIRAAIAQIAAAGREPDLWERVHIVAAISMLFRGAYSLGGVDAENAMVLAEERSARPNLPTDPFFDRCDLALLKAALREAEAEPVRDWPHCGPVVFERPTRS
jgi:hypothetical protein